MYYVYVHRRKQTNKIFHIGKGTKSKSGINRIESNKNRNIHWQRIVDKDGGFNYEIYKDNLTEEQAFGLEIQLIEEIGLKNLTNMTIGGTGGDTLSNHPNIKEIGKKISKKLSGKNHYLYGSSLYKHWIKILGKKEADIRMKKYRKTLSVAQKNAIHPKRNEPWVETLKKKYGDNWETIYNEVNEKIRKSKLNQKKVKCKICGIIVGETRLLQHQKGKKCLTTKN